MKPIATSAGGRGFCARCRRTARTCLCAHLRPFEPGPLVVILLHPKEARKKVGTGRLTHLSLKGSRLFEGVDFTDHAALNALLTDPTIHPVVVFPGPSATDVTRNAALTLDPLVPRGRRLALILLDGSWSCAKKILRVSANLRALPCIRFDPPGRSRYAIRRQPEEICWSTIEATHFLLSELAVSPRFSGEPGLESFLTVFDELVRSQLQFATTPGGLRKRAARGSRTSHA